MKGRVKKLLQNLAILFVISIIIGSTLKIENGLENYYQIKTYYSIAIFFNLIPVAYFMMKFQKAKKQPIYFIGFVFYYLIILPVWTTVIFKNSMISDLNIEGMKGMTSLNIIMALNVFLLIVSQFFIFKYVFLDIITGKRKAKNTDIGIVLLTYITLGVTYGFLYVIVLSNNHNAISGITLENLTGLEIYFKSIYFSFITLTSVGYGEVLPTSLLAQGLAMLESVMGVLLLSFSLGVVFSSNLNHEEETKELENDEFKKLKKQLMKEFEESLDKNLDKIISNKKKEE
jgi:hypothetical protein